MNDCYNFQNSTGLDIGDILEEDKKEIINLIDLSSNNNYSYTSNSSNYLFKYTSNSIDITNDNLSNLSFQLYDFNKYINPLPIIYKEPTTGSLTGSTVIKISEVDGEIKFDTVYGNEVYTKIDTNGQLKVYHEADPTLPTRAPGWWDVHDDLTTLLRDTIGLRFDMTENQAVDLEQTAQIQANTAAITAIEAVDLEQSIQIEANTVAIAGLTASVAAIEALDAVQTAQIEANSAAIAGLSGTTIPSIITNVAALELNKQDKISVDKPFDFVDNKLSLRYDTSLILDENQDKIRINSNLNITKSLLIGNSITTTSDLHIHTNSTDKNQRLQITDGNTGTGLTDGFMITKFANNDTSIINNEYGNLILGANGNEAIRIKPNGNIGINNNSPSDTYKLDIEGNLNIGNGDLYINDISFGTTSNNLYKYAENSSNNLIDHVEYTSNNLFTSLYDINFQTSNNLITYNNTTITNLTNNHTEGIYTKRFIQSETAKTNFNYPDSSFEVEDAIYVRNDYYTEGATGTRTEIRAGRNDHPFTQYTYMLLDANNDISLHTCNQMMLKNFNTYITSKGNIETSSANCYFNASTKLKINTPFVLYNEIPANFNINFYYPIANNYTYSIPYSYYYCHLHIERYVPAKLLDTGEKVRVFKILAIREGDWNDHDNKKYGNEYITLKDELTIYMSNTIRNQDNQVSLTTDDICNSRVYGKTKNSNFGYFLPFNTGETNFIHPNINGFPFNNLFYATKQLHKLYVSITPLIYNYQ